MDKNKLTGFISSNSNTGKTILLRPSSDQICLPAENLRTAGSRFESEDLGVHSLKGMAEPVNAWRIVAPAAVESRFEARQRAGLTPLIGREHEIGLMLERRAQAKKWDGQVILLSGEAGIGKSRITEALQERTEGDTLFFTRRAPPCPNRNMCCSTKEEALPDHARTSTAWIRIRHSTTLL